jgi:serine/threonine protein kinase
MNPSDLPSNDSTPTVSMQLPQSHHQHSHQQQEQPILLKMMSSSTSRRLTDQIHSSVRESVSKSRLSRLQQKDQLVLVDRSQLVVHDFLGSGAFSQVHLVTTTTSNRTFAMKHIKPELLRQGCLNEFYFDYGNNNNAMNDEANMSFCLAACELAVEAHLLASFDHPNIIAIRGWAANGVASFANGCRHDSFFLLLDPLQESLDQRLARWKDNRLTLHGSHAASSSATRTSIPLRPKQDGFWSRWAASSLHPHQQHIHNEQQEQLQQEFIDDPVVYAEKLCICAEIASALAYLHSLHVIYRDLKPNNIGFLSDGRVQLFDFGLSRELPSTASGSNHTSLQDAFQMSGKVGTLRYMASEVAMHQPYTVSADVYSYSMVAYEILTLQKPFQGWTRDMHSKLVCGRHLRPDVSPLTLTTTAATRPPSSQLVRPLIEASWSSIPMQRPSMHMVYEQMTKIQQDCQQQLLVVLSNNTESAIPTTHSSVTVQTSQQQGQQQQRSVSIELPPDFDVRKKSPNRSVSASTKTTVSMSTGSLAAAEHGGQYCFFG